MKEKDTLSSSAIIAPLDEADIPNLRVIGLAIPEFSVGTDSPSFYSEEALLRMAQSSEAIILVAKVKEEIAGFILTSLLVPARDAYIHTLAVTEPFRQQGIASELLSKTLAEIRIRQPKINHIFTSIQIENKASLNLFRKHGFQVGQPLDYVDLMLE